MTRRDEQPEVEIHPRLFLTVNQAIIIYEDGKFQTHDIQVLLLYIYAVTLWLWFLQRGRRWYLADDSSNVSRPLTDTGLNAIADGSISAPPCVCVCVEQQRNFIN